MLKKEYCIAVVNLCDYIRKDEDFKKLNANLDDFLNSMDYDDFKTYLMDKKYIDIAYFTSNNYVFDLDSIYLDYKAYIED